MNRMLATVGALLVAGFATADDGAYLIECTILEGDRVVGSPTVVAQPGKQVSVSVTNTFELVLKAEEQGDGRIALSADLALPGEAYSQALLVELDRPSEIRIGDATLTVMVRKFVPGDV